MDVITCDEAFTWPRAAGLGEADPDGSMCEQRAREVGAHVVVEDRQTSVVVPSTLLECCEPVGQLTVDHVARRVVDHAALALRCSRNKLKFHGTDTDTDILDDFRARIRSACHEPDTHEPDTSPTCPPTCPTCALFLARMSVRDASVYTYKCVLYTISYRVPVYKITR